MVHPVVAIVDEDDGETLGSDWGFTKRQKELLIKEARLLIEELGG